MVTKSHLPTGFEATERPGTSFSAKLQDFGTMYRLAMAAE